MPSNTVDFKKVHHLQFLYDSSRLVIYFIIVHWSPFAFTCIVYVSGITKLYKTLLKKKIHHPRKKQGRKLCPELVFPLRKENVSLLSILRF